MKKYVILLSLFLFAGSRMKALADTSDSLGLPGDNLDLYGVLDLFKQSSSLEDFEKKLNDPANEVNNLDLNEDGNVDYIRVSDTKDGDSHAIILQVPVSATESQDVAAIELEKTGTESADVQIVGDEELYGENYIVEANPDASVETGKWQEFRPMNVVVNVWLWPSVRYIYAPTYVVWVSPWRWSYYPVYWHPWHPVMWRVHYARVTHYHAHYVCVHEYRMSHANGVYHAHRVASPAVHQRYVASHERHAANTKAQSGRTAGKGNVQPQSRDHGSPQATGRTGNQKSAGKKDGQQKAPRQKANAQKGATHKGGGGGKKGGGGRR